MNRRFRPWSLPVGLAIACMAFAGSASAAGTPYSGTVANGGCDGQRAVTVSGPSRIEITLGSTAQNNVNVFAEVFDPTGKAVAGGSRVAYDTPGAGTYTWRVCSEYQQQSPPRFAYSALLGTGPAGQPVLVGQPQPQPPTGGVLGARTKLAATPSGKVAIRVRAGLAWFTVGTASNGTTTLRVYNPMRGTTRVVRGENAVVSGKTIRISGHGVSLVLTKSGMGRAAYSSSTFKAQGKIVRGHFQLKV